MTRTKKKKQKTKENGSNNLEKVLNFRSRREKSLKNTCNDFFIRS